MKIAISTLGCPGKPLSHVARLAVEHGIDALQLRVADDEPINTQTSSVALREASTIIADHGLVIDSLATYLTLADERLTHQLPRHLELAEQLEVQQLRIFGGDTTIERAAEALAHAAELARGYVLRLETHDNFVKASDVASILAMVDTPTVAATWDILHTFRANETPEISYTALAPWLVEFQIKDIPSVTNTRPISPGTGVLPLRETLALLKSHQYEGTITFEHETKWRRDAEPFTNALQAAKNLIVDEWQK